MKKQGKIYIAGPMRGIELFNFPAFDQARDYLKARGWEVVSPADMDREIGFEPANLPDNMDWSSLEKSQFCLDSAIKRDIAAITDCDAVYMLHGWEGSRGAKAEHALAEWMGKTILYEDTGWEWDGDDRILDYEPEPTRDILEEALEITKCDRNQDYGHPADDFSRTAKMWGAMFGFDFKPHHVAQAMIAVKLSRLAHAPKRDSVVDIAGYARCMDLCYTRSGEY